MAPWWSICARAESFVASIRFFCAIRHFLTLVLAKVMQPEPRNQTPAAERWLETLLFASRWLMAPFYAGLVVALAGLLVVFANELATEVWHILELTPEAGS
jgi:Uncharacterized protein family, UPF0114